MGFQCSSNASNKEFMNFACVHCEPILIFAVVFTEWNF